MALQDEVHVFEVESARAASHSTSPARVLTTRCICTHHELHVYPSRGVHVPIGTGLVLLLRRPLLPDRVVRLRLHLGHA